MILQKDLPNGHISCMIDDKNGNTWLGSNAGFITLNNKNNASYPMHYRRVITMYVG